MRARNGNKNIRGLSLYDIQYVPTLNQNNLNFDYALFNQSIHLYEKYVSNRYSMTIVLFKLDVFNGNSNSPHYITVYKCMHAVHAALIGCFFLKDFRQVQTCREEE